MANMSNNYPHELSSFELLVQNCRHTEKLISLLKEAGFPIRKIEELTISSITLVLSFPSTSDTSFDIHGNTPQFACQDLSDNQGESDIQREFQNRKIQ